MEELLKTLDELKAEADGLGIKYHPKTGAKKLAGLIEEHYVKLESADIVQEVEDTDKDVEDVEDEVIEDDYIEETIEDEPVPLPTPRKPKETVKKSLDVSKMTPAQRQRHQIKVMKEKAFKKRVVTISSNDKRESEYTTTAYLSLSNQHMDLARIVPLDVPVELEQCLINVAKTTTIILHKDEIVNGRRTGNKTAQMVRKYNVSYEDMV